MKTAKPIRNKGEQGMKTVSFSSWGGKVIDNRKGRPAKAAKVEAPLTIDGGAVTALMGWNGIVVADPSVDILSLTLAYLEEARKLSCGECSVCLIGIDRMLELLKARAAGKGTKADLDEMEQIVRGVAANAKCNFGRAAALNPVGDALKYFRADFANPAASAGKTTAKTYRVAVTAPCMEACPATLDIPGYIELIRNGRFGESLNLIRERCILPGVTGRVCTHPCEDACVRKDLDQSLAIRLLKRAAADADLKAGGTPLAAPAALKKEKVAVIGAGPAGLAAAYHLRLLGYGVTVFESLPHAGGMAAVGIPDYRLPKDILNYEIDLVRRLGVEIRLNEPVGRIDPGKLKKAGYAAVFIAVGAHAGNAIGAEGEDAGYDGFMEGIEFLRRISLGQKIAPRRKVVIIGGGNVAIDCARTCLRLGFGEVEILYRRSLAEMPARAEEIAEAQEEGVKIRFLAAPLKVVAKNGKVTAIECIKMKLGEPDASGRRRPVPVKGSEFSVKTEMIIPAIGQNPALPTVAGTEALAVAKGNTVAVDAVTLRTNLDGVFAGGDCVTGPATLIEALDMGNRAARSIDLYLQGKSPAAEHPFAGIDTRAQRTKGFVSPAASGEAALLPAKTRIAGFDEVEGGFDAAAAIREANRCLRCYRLMVWA